MKTVVVLGLRSGTSLMASMLKDVGIYMGSNFIEHTPNNKYGHFEELSIKKANDELLVSIGKTTFDLTVERKELGDVNLNEVFNCAETLEKLQRKPIWGFKNPMLVWTLPVWNLLLRNPHYILCTRKRENQIASLRKMSSDQEIPNAESWMDKYWNTAYSYLKGKNFIEVDFDDMIENPEENFERVLRFLEYPVAPWALKNALQRVEPQERHFR